MRYPTKSPGEKIVKGCCQTNENSHQIAGAA